jgi:hypothetical protein
VKYKLNRLKHIDDAYRYSDSIFIVYDSIDYDKGEKEFISAMLFEYYIMRNKTRADSIFQFARENYKDFYWMFICAQKENGILNHIKNGRASE